MPLILKIVTIVGLGAWFALPAFAQVMAWGVFREVLADAPLTSLHCWSQAMISGQTINGELMTTTATQDDAVATVNWAKDQGLCLDDRRPSDG
jgi:hypothetical protein